MAMAAASRYRRAETLGELATAAALPTLWDRNFHLGTTFVPRRRISHANAFLASSGHSQ
jgi:hypothetical protein